MRRTITAIFASMLLWAITPIFAGEDEWSIDWSTIDGGGELFTEGGEWQLSGTIGQWDAHGPSTGDGWVLTGGFWAMTAEELSGFIFSDRFEGD